jgi:predicted permease
LKQPGFAGVVTLIVALGIGANTAVFSYVSSLFFAPLPIAEPERVVRVFGSSKEGGNTDVFSYPDYLGLRDRNRSFEALAVHRFVSVNLSAGGEAENAKGELVSGNYFSVMRIRPALGRVLTPEDDEAPGSHARLVISYGIWQRRFGGASDAVGRTLHLNGFAYSVVGVAPPEFRGSHPVEPADFWVPVMMYQQIRTGGARKNDIYKRGWGWLTASARLRPGISQAQAADELLRISRDMEKEHPKELRGVTFVTYPARALPEQSQKTVGGVLGFSLAVTGVLLLVACANIAAMLLARVAQRNREMAIRLSLGAGRGRLMRQWLTESVLWAAPGGAAGLLLSLWTTDALGRLIPTELVGVSPEISADSRVLAFALVATTMTGLLIGLIPALRAGRANLSIALKEGGAAGGERHTGRMHGAFVVVQSAACLILLIVAGLLVRSLSNSWSFHPGFRTDNLLLANMDIGRNNYTEDSGRAFYEQLRQSLRTIPGVESVSYATTVPLGFGQDSMGVQIPGHTPPAGRHAFSISYNIVGPAYLSTMGIPLVAGRGFDERDAEKGAQPVVVINETMARRFWGNESPVGKSFRISGGFDVEIIGVARDIKYYSLGELPRPFIYGSVGQFYEGSLILHVRTRSDAAAFAQPLRRAVAALDANVATYSTMTFAEMRSFALFPARAMAAVASIFGGLVLVLTALGVYGLVSYSVSQRTREIGIRMALGARRGDVLTLELRRGMFLVVLGLLAGSAAAAGVSQLVKSQLFGVSPLDPATYLLSAVLLTVVGMAACLVPARRAMRVQPMQALRYE